MRQRSRRLLALLLVVLGGVLMVLAPELWGGGLIVLAAGVAIELVGIALEHKASRRQNDRETLR